MTFHKRLKKFARRIVSAFVMLVLVGSGAIVQAETSPQLPSLLITELQTGNLNAENAEQPKGEFVELFNPTDTSVTVESWRVEFLTKTHDGTSPATRTLANLTGNVAPLGHMVISYADYIPDAAFYFSGGPSTGYLPKSDGTVRIVNNLGEVIDMVGYGAPNNFRTQAAPAPAAGHSLQRCFTNGTVGHTDSNVLDFALYSTPTPHRAIDCPISEPEPGDEEPSPNTTCEGAIITELLANPAGSDSGKEFIELYNPTDVAITLQGCSLQTTANSKVFSFGSTQLQPGEYRAFFASQTALSLQNAAGGTAWLLSPTEELQAIIYPADPPDDAAWALFGTTWQGTYTPTPNAANILTAHKPCPAGQVRNSETGRCATPASAATTTSTLTPCKEGQVRNPQTNRCRAIASTASTLAPCQPGQTRNPETNRCKKVEVAAQLTPCPEGQERNPDTNRCRKTAAIAAATNVQDIAAPANNTTMTVWWLAGVGIAGALGYAAFEWRQELATALGKIKDKFIPPGKN